MQSPSVWGPVWWGFLNSLVLNYPSTPSATDKINMKTLLLTIGVSLPCERCRGNFNKHIEKYPLDDDALKCRGNLTKWIINIHNEVNIMTGKPVLNYDDALRCMLEGCDGGKNNLYFTMILTILFVIMVCGGIYLLVKKIDI